jgi:hypothetical protein
MDTENTSLPKTKKEADQRLRELAPVGTTIEVNEPHTFDARNRLLSFIAITQAGARHDINSLVARIWDMRFMDVPGKSGQALYAWDTGNEAGSAIVAQLAFRLHHRHNAYHYTAAPKEILSETMVKEQKEQEGSSPERGMLTPDGTIQTVAVIVSGVSWVDTGSHGFLVLSSALARCLLTPQAYAIGENRCGWVFFEEDCAIAAPLFEHPEWQSWSGFSTTSYNPEEVLRRYFPGYFDAPMQLGLPLEGKLAQMPHIFTKGSV